MFLSRAMFLSLAVLKPAVAVTTTRALSVVPKTRAQCGFSFTPSGLAFPYGLGAGAALQEAGALTVNTPLAGASGGALVAAVIAASECGALSVDDAFEAALRVNHYCRERGTARGNLRDALKLELDVLLNDEAVRHLNERPAPVSVGVFRFAPLPRGEIVSNYEDLADLKSALLATSCIPFYFAKTPAVMFRGWPAVDGFFATSKSKFGAPDAVPRAVSLAARADDEFAVLSPVPPRTVRICPFDADLVGLVGEVLGPGDAPLAPSADLFACALGMPPADDKLLIDLYERGRQDAREWLARESLLFQEA